MPGVALFAALQLLAPRQIGGPASYVTTYGTSMLPRLHQGDLAIVREAGSYGVGDVVFYRSPMLYRMLHRIESVTDGRYTFKGDNNSFLDPGRVTRGDLVGKL